MMTRMLATSPCMANSSHLTDPLCLWPPLISMHSQHSSTWGVQPTRNSICVDAPRPPHRKVVLL